MKNISIYYFIKIRKVLFWIFWIAISVAGLWMIRVDNINDIGIVNGLCVLLSWSVAAIACMLNMSSGLKDITPISYRLYKIYRFILLMCVISLFLPGIIHFLNYDGFIESVIYAGVCSIGLGMTLLAMRLVERIYQDLIESGKIDLEIQSYYDRVKGMSDCYVDSHRKSFTHFLIWILVLSELIRFSLGNWYLILAVVFLNIVINCRIHKAGVKSYIAKSGTYMFVALFIQTIGVLIINYLFVNKIVVPFMSEKDRMEYAMMILPFCIPMMIYGNKVSTVYVSKAVRWTA